MAPVAIAGHRKCAWVTAAVTEVVDLALQQRNLISRLGQFTWELLAWVICCREFASSLSLREVEQQLRVKTQSSDRFSHRWQGFDPLHLTLRRLHSLLQRNRQSLVMYTGSNFRDHATMVYPRRFERPLVGSASPSNLLFPSSRFGWGAWVGLSEVLPILTISSDINKQDS